jgi:CheY-like chemotaxis protein
MTDLSAAPEARGRILVAEDEPHIRRILTAMLESALFDVIAVEDGQAAIEALSGEEPTDLVITDLMMPRATGLDVLERIRSFPHRRDTPVVVLTAKGQDTDREAALALGAAEFITKPFSPKKLLARISEILGD